MEIQFWENTRGENPVGGFIEGQEVKAKKKILWMIDMLEEHGIKLLFTGYMNKLQGHKLYELVTSFGGVFYRIFFSIKEDTAWLLHAFKKKTNHTPKKELSIAIDRAKSLR